MILSGAQPWPIRVRAAFAVVGVIALATRRLDHLMVPQFYAEDASKFFVDAESMGWRALLVPVASYHNLTARLVAGLFSPLPWEWLPLLYSLAALAITLGIAIRIFTARIPRPAALIGGVAMLAIPSQGEVLLNLCCLHFLFAAVIAVNLLQPPPDSKPEALRRAVEMTVSALSGPEVIVLLPLSFWRGWEWRNNRPALYGLCSLWLASVIQAVAIFSVTRASFAHTFPPLALLPLYTKDLFAPGLPADPLSGSLVTILMCAGFTALFCYSRYRVPAAMLILLAVGFLMAGRSVNSGWPNPFGNGSRYVFIPFVFVAWALGWLYAGSSQRRYRIIALVLMVAIGVSSVLHWTGPIPPNHRWTQQVREARAGERTVFVIPGPHTWYVPVPATRAARE